MGVCNCSMFCCALLCVHSGNAIVLVGGGESWLLCLVCLPGVCGGWAALPRGATGLSAVCGCGVS